jgi:hypothetical protein
MSKIEKPIEIDVHILERIFSNRDGGKDTFTIMKNTDIDYIDYVDYEIIWSDKNGQQYTCSTLLFYDDHIYCKYLNKCGNNSGNMMLKKLDEIPTVMPNVKYIKLIDESTIIFKFREIEIIPLSILKILSSGKSWYNSYGYISENYKNEIKHNAGFLDMNCIDFLNLVNQKRQPEYDAAIAEINKTYTIHKDSRNRNIYTRKATGDIINYTPTPSCGNIMIDIDVGIRLGLVPESENVKEWCKGINFILTFIQNIKQDRSMSDIVIWIGKTMTLISDSHILQYDIHLKKRFDTKSKSSSSKQKTTP